MPIFWAIYFQIFSLWVEQAEAMNLVVFGFTIPASSTTALNPIFVRGISLICRGHSADGSRTSSSFLSLPRECTLSSREWGYEHYIHQLTLPLFIFLSSSLYLYLSIYISLPLYLFISTSLYLCLSNSLFLYQVLFLPLLVSTSTSLLQLSHIYSSLLLFVFTLHLSRPSLRGRA